MYLASTSSSLREMEASTAQMMDEPDPEQILHSKRFQQSLQVMERTVLLNIYQHKLATYRGLPILPGNEQCLNIHLLSEMQHEFLNQMALLKHYFHNVCCVCPMKSLYLALVFIYFLSSVCFYLYVESCRSTEHVHGFFSFQIQTVCRTWV